MLERVQWCELHHGPAHDARAVRVGCHADERYTVMVCPECVKELVRDLGWAQRTDTFKWDCIIPDVQQFEALIHFLRRADGH